MKQRIESLDWLRGLMAITIMLYHLFSWKIVLLDSSSILGRMGIYGVSIFFVLSGLSMAIVYSNYIVGLRSSVLFFIRRIFRIWPLLWICVGLVLFLEIRNGGTISVMKVISNLTTLFGFINPSDYINTGAWSIGNEMVYYALTPLIIILYNKRRSIGNLLFFVVLAVSLYFSFVLLDSSVSLGDQWKTYINPFNNLFLYISGIAIYFNLGKVKFKPYVVVGLFIMSVGIFAFYPVFGGQIQIVTGLSRCFFLFASIALVLSFYKFPWYQYVPRFISLPLEQLGIATYGVYLLHPIIYKYLSIVYRKIELNNKYIQISIVIITTIFAALVSYKYFECRMIKIGKNITSSKNKH